MARRKAAGSEIVEGIVTADPELRLGRSLRVIFPIEIDMPAGEAQRGGKPVAYVVCFGALANDVTCMVSEGTRVVVTGRVETRPCDQWRRGGHGTADRRRHRRASEPPAMSDRKHDATVSRQCLDNAPSA